MAVDALRRLLRGLVLTHAMAVWAARLGVELHLQMLQQAARQVARDSWRPLALLLVVVV